MSTTEIIASFSDSFTEDEQIEIGKVFEIEGLTYTAWPQALSTKVSATFPITSCFDLALGQLVIE
jgi:hypothetical protein